MLKQKYGRIIPNQKITTEPANSEVTSYIMDRDEMNAKYGAYKAPMNRKFER